MAFKVLLHPPTLTAEDKAAVQAALETGWVAPAGPALETLKQWVFEYTGYYAVPVNSGTAAIHLALHILKQEFGQDIMVVYPDFTFAGAVFPAVHLGMDVAFAACAEGTFNVSENKVEEMVAKTNKHVVLVNTDLYGNPSIITKELENATLLHDAAESVGSTFNSKPVGLGSRFITWSFNGNKLVACGGGGLLLCKNQEDAALATKLAHQAKEPKPFYWHEQAGFNMGMNNVLAALVHSQLLRLDEIVQVHRDGLAHFKQLLNELDVQWQQEVEGAKSNAWLAVLLLPKGKKASDLMPLLHAAGYEARHFWWPMHVQPVFKKVPHALNGNEMNIAERGICLPNGPHVQAEHREEMAAIISRFVNT